jgi:hypothetical protein
VGLKEGFIKVVDFHPSPEAMKHCFYSHKLEQKHLVQIMLPSRETHPQNICFILLEDSKVFLFNYRSRMLVAVFHPPMLGHDLALSLALHPSDLAFATGSQSGQVVFWQVGKDVEQAIALSEERGWKWNGAEESGLEEEVWKFKRKDRIISVFPTSMMHCATIDGLKWLDFMGNLLALVTRKGVFKLIAVNFELKDEFITLIEFPIAGGEAISSVQLYP